MKLKRDTGTQLLNRCYLCPFAATCKRPGQSQIHRGLKVGLTESPAEVALQQGLGTERPWEDFQRKYRTLS